MAKYARIESESVVEVFSTDGDMAQMFHPDMVWISVPVELAVEAGWRYSKGAFIAPRKTALLPEQFHALVFAVAQSLLDAEAKKLSYDGIETAISFAEEPRVPQFQTEGRALRAWRSAVRLRCLEIIDSQDLGDLATVTEEHVRGLLPGFELGID